MLLKDGVSGGVLQHPPTVGPATWPPLAAAIVRPSRLRRGTTVPCLCQQLAYLQAKASRAHPASPP